MQLHSFFLFFYSITKYQLAKIIIITKKYKIVLKVKFFGSICIVTINLNSMEKFLFDEKFN